MGELIKSKKDRLQTRWRWLLSLEIVALEYRRPKFGLSVERNQPFGVRKLQSVKWYRKI